METRTRVRKLAKVLARDAKGLAKEVVLPAFVDENLRPRRPKEVATRLAGIPFEVIGRIKAHEGASVSSNASAPASAASFQHACALEAIPTDGTKVVELSGQQVVLYRVDENVYASANRCPHASGPIGEGELCGNVITCPLHGWTFDVSSGECINMAGEKLETYPTKLDGGQVLVALN